MSDTEKKAEQKKEEESAAVKAAVEQMKVAFLMAVAGLMPSVAKALDAWGESIVIRARAGSEIASANASVIKTQSAVALLQAQTEQRRVELVAPIETEAKVAEAEAKRSQAQLLAKKAAHELLAWTAAPTNGPAGKQEPARQAHS